MGKKINPKIVRITTVTRAWDARWFSDKRGDYRTNLVQDMKIRQYFALMLRTASISRIEIQRQQRETVLTIHTSRPAVVIGRGGSGIEKIQKDLKKIVGGRLPVKINVQEVLNPDTDAMAVATQVVDQLERRFPFRRILKQAVQRSMQAGGRGVRIMLSGRLNGSEIARREWLADGNVPLHTFRTDISYARKTAFTSFGTIGVKVWINRGELAKDEAEPEEQASAAVEKPKKEPRRRSSLAEKVTRKPARGVKKSPK